jgi:hypothetical protein
MMQLSFNRKHHNVTGDHNAEITLSPVRPRIFFNGEPTEDIVREVIGARHRGVREFTPAFFQPGTAEHRELENTVSESDRAALKALVLIRSAYVTDDPIARQSLQDATYQLMPDYSGHVKHFFQNANPKKIAGKEYPGLMRQYMRKARLVVSRGFVPAILCPDLSTAMFVFAAFRGISCCLNCQKLFALDLPRVDGSAGERYCTARCGQAYRQKVYRLRVKSKSKPKRKGHKR